MGWECGAYGWGEGVYRVLVGKPEGKRPLGRPSRRWVDNIRMDLQEVGCGYMDWTWLDQDRDSWRTLVSAVMNLRVPWNAGNFLNSCKPVSFSRRTLHHGVSKYGGVEVQAHSFLTMVLDRGEWSTSHPGRFTPGWGKYPDSVGTAASVDDLQKWKFPTRIRTPDRPARNTDYAKKSSAKDMYQQLQHVTHTVCSCAYNNSHNTYSLCV